MNEFVDLGAFSDPRIRLLATTRQSPISSGDNSFNLATHVGDDPLTVAKNRAVLRSYVPAEPQWLNQVHGTDVAVFSVHESALATADASVTATPGVVLSILTADCLPVLFASKSGTVIGAAHAGWRGLLAGVLERTVEQMHVLERRDATTAVIEARFGVAIGPTAFEVGDEVRDAFCEQNQATTCCFVPSSRQGKWLANLYDLARLRLKKSGVEVLGAQTQCTFNNPRQFYSHRQYCQQASAQFPRQSAGRQATLIWIDPGS